MQAGGPQYGGPQYGGMQAGDPQSGGPQYGGMQAGGTQSGGPQSGGSPLGGPPTSPPPSYVPQMQQAGLYAVDPGSMRRCLYRFTYVWLRSGSSFWFYPTYIGRNSVAGYRWRQNQRRWVYFGIDTNQIRSFQCN
nr:hypothetical protein [Peribacillus glennii]